MRGTSGRVLVAVLLFSIAAAAAFADLNSFVGQWVNVDSNTRGITALNIGANGPQLSVQAWGQAHPSDIDWGVVPGFAYAASVSDNIFSAARAVSATYATNFSETVIIIKPKGQDRLEVETFTRFTDNSQRAGYTAVYSFRRNVPTLQAPQQISPQSGSVFNHFPRNTTLSWTAVNGAASYTVEVDYFDSSWVTTRGKTYILARNVNGLDYSFNFVGAQAGRWRVWAVGPDGRESPKSPWWEFKYTR